MCASEKIVDGAGAGRPSGSVMVLGGGIGGIQAALDCAESGFSVHLVTDSPSIGGKMAQWDKTFPTNDCSMCLLGPKMSECGAHPNIEVHSLTTIDRVSGEAGRYQVTLSSKARFIDTRECTSCGECADVCPVQRPDEFNFGLAHRKAVYKYFPQAVPNAYVIEKRGVSPCRMGCPAGVHTHGYVTLIARGRYREAWALVRRDNPFVSVCGTVCHNPCEKVCQRGEFDQPIAIKNLKAFLGHYILTKDRDWALEQATPVEPLRDERVAVFGSGPAGLTCAYHLARQGYPVTVFEALPVAGGLMRVGIPEYRLPRDFVDTEIDLIRRMGVEIQTGVSIGGDLKVQDVLDQGYRAVFISVGAHEGEKTAIPGHQLAGVFHGVSFLRRVNLGELGIGAVGRRVAVIGGGFTAVDCARTAVRLGAEHVEVIFKDSEADLYALPEEVSAARREGVRFTCLTTPLRIRGQVHVEGVELLTWLIPGEWRRPVPERGSERVVAFDTVLLGTSEVPTETFFREDDDLGWSAEGTIVVDPLTLKTSHEGVFAGGEAVTGPGTVIDAIASGKTAAESITRFLQGRDLAEGRRRWPKPEEVARLDLGHLEVPHRPRVRPYRSPAEAPPGAEAFGGYTEEMAREEAARCLDCGICAECMRCEEVCERRAVDHSAIDRRIEVEVGSIILAPGFSTYDATRAGEYGYGRYPNVITAPELERLLSSTGPTAGQLQRPSDRSQPRRVAFLQCVGSRDIRVLGRPAALGGSARGQAVPYCSGVCCMFALKEALLIRERDPSAEVTIYNLDLRAYGKDFQRYVDSAREAYGVRVVNSLVSAVREDPVSGNLLITRALDIPPGAPINEVFDMVVLSVGFQPPAAAEDLAQRLGIRLGETGFAGTEPERPVATSRPGVFVAGGFLGPRDIPETIISASAAAASTGALLALARGDAAQAETYPPEIDITGMEPRVGVFVCHCGINIASVVDVDRVVDTVSRVPGVVHAQSFLYTCSQDSLSSIRETITKKGLNRVVMAACTVRTHQAIFRDTLRRAGLNPFLFQMANIREQCSWVHKAQKRLATEKACDLARMAAAKARRLEPLMTFEVPVLPRALIIGGGPAGLRAAASLAEQGFPSYLVEREPVLGGNLRRLARTAEFSDAAALLQELVREVDGSELIEVITGAEVESLSGRAGHFTTTVVSKHGGEPSPRTLKHGVTIVATGSDEVPTARCFPSLARHPRVFTSLGFAGELAAGRLATAPTGAVAFLLCAGSRGYGGDGEAVSYCSRTCCTQAVDSALAYRRSRPDADVYVLYRDMMTYAHFEDLYRAAREEGVRFIRFPEASYPEVTVASDDPSRLEIRAIDAGINALVTLRPDLLVLATPAVPATGTPELARILKVALTPDGFFSEVHAKLGPLDLPTLGLFVAGGAHGPKHLSEVLLQAEGSAGRAATILSKASLTTGGIVAEVDPEKCAACLSCVRVCPYNVPVINQDAVAEIDPVQCRGCGTCAGECPARAIELPYYRNLQLEAVIEELFRAAT